MKISTNLLLILCCASACKARNFNQDNQVKKLSLMPETPLEQVQKLIIFPQVHCLTRSNCKDLGITPSDEALQTAKLMLNVFARLPPLENSLTLFTGLPTSGETLALSKAKTEKDIRFMSSSRDKNTAEIFLFGTPE